MSSANTPVDTHQGRLLAKGFTPDAITQIQVDGSVPYKATNMPNCTGFKAFVLPGAFYGACVALMAESGFQKADSVEEADVVVFIGGEDINPALYGQKNIKSSFTLDRDVSEEWYYGKALKANIPMFGICRGAQFLHAMNGGQLWQNVNNHGGRNHEIIDIEDDVLIEVTSLHHQMLQDTDDKNFEVIAVTTEQVATKFEDANMVINLDAKGGNAWHEMEIEAGCWKNTRCFFVQGHPEIGNPQFRSWVMMKLYEFLLDWLPFIDDPDMEAVRKDVEAELTKEETAAIVAEVSKQIG